jgi:hypothetical protein
LVDHAPVSFDTTDQLMVACAIAVTLLIGAVILITNRPREARRWIGHACLVVAALVAVGSVTAALLPDRPAMAAPAVFDARTATASALAQLAAEYRPDAGVWDTIDGPGWWQSAVAMDDLIQAEQALDTHAYDWMLAQTFQQTPDTYSHKIIRWRGPYYDDAAWWGVAWLDAYNWTGQHRYLVAAQGVAAWLERGRTTSCGGGVEWGDPTDILHGAQKNTITNTLTVTLDAGLYQTTHQAVYLRHAVATWRWLRGTGLVRPGWLVADHLDAHCRPVGVRWSYTQGESITAGLALSQATGDQGYRTTAASIAEAATTNRMLNPSGILREPCAPRLCGHNGDTFAGPYVTALGQVGGHARYLARQADYAYTHDRMVGDRYGLLGLPHPDRTSSGRQASAVALFATELTADK